MVLGWVQPSRLSSLFDFLVRMLVELSTTEHVASGKNQKNEIVIVKSKKFSMNKTMVFADA